ncbi:MAG: acetyl-CoA carboxylase carboxyltransferase subunit beta [Peptococcaceae bacterium]|nr:acetyl-CoA carboxylase carboxyltransferase subunit beta [Peptococcaceae bacterium]
MLEKRFFRKPKNELEHQEDGRQNQPSVPDDLYISCPECKHTVLKSDMEENLFVCPECDYHFKMIARQRIQNLTDSGTFHEMYADLSPVNLLDFPGYDEKLTKAQQESGELEGVICGTAQIGGFPVALFVMDPGFILGSMGTIVGEKITRLFEYAAENRLPVIGYTVSGGARMQEGILSLMQMAKTSGAVKRHSDAGGLYITILTNPTTGGVTASFAMEGDIILAEPKALVAFAGPRVIEQTIRQKLPSGFQRAEFLLEKGFIDAIVHRNEQKAYLTTILKLHQPYLLDDRTKGAI